MSFFNYNVSKVLLSPTHIKVILTDGRESSKSLASFPLLNKASEKERNNFEIIGGYALYWKNIGEDLSIAGFFE